MSHQASVFMDLSKRVYTIGGHLLVRISHYYQLIILTFVVFLSRVPFLGYGFGNNPDSWRVADTARRIALSGNYSYSRPPGHPFQELFYSLMWEASPTRFNVITALFSVGVFIFFYLSLAKLNCKKSLLGALTLVFIPVVYINSTNSMDFIWALFFILGSFYFALDHKLALAGIFLGLAIGCRITSAAMLIPIGLIVYYQNTSRVKSILTFLVWTIILGLAIYIPVIYSYKFNFLTFAENGYPSYLSIIKKLSLNVWGIPGSLAIIISVVFFGVRYREINNLLRARDPIILASISAIVIYLLMYLRLPVLSAYLIPLLPFVILLMDKLFDTQWFIGICVILILSSFFLTLNNNRQIKLAGPIFQDRQSRNELLLFSNRVLDKASRLSKNSIIVSGAYLPMLEWQLNKHPVDGVNFVYLLTPNDLENALNNPGTQLYFLPGVDRLDKNIYNINLSDYGGKPLLLDDSAGG